MANEMVDSSNGSEEPRARGTITRDPEVVAIVKITAAIDSLSESARDRVLMFLADKYNIGSE